MNIDDHSRHLGGLIANLNSLEFIIRAFLTKIPGAKPLDTLPKGTDMYTLPIGTELLENDVTNYDTLGTIVEKFNTVSKQSGAKEIDKTIIEIRDAFAHGRVSAPAINDQLRLIKFSKPQNGKVKITFNEILTEEWFKERKKLVYDAIHLVHELDSQMFNPPV